MEPNYIHHTTDFVTQSNSTWGLASLSHKFPGNVDYVYDNSAGKGMSWTPRHCRWPRLFMHSSAQTRCRVTAAGTWASQA